MRRRSWFYIFFLTFCFNFLWSQEDIQVRPRKNIEIHQDDFNSKRFHFGSFFSGNRHYHTVLQKENYIWNGQNLERAYQKGNWGFSVGLLGEYHFLWWLSLRFMPEFSLEKSDLFFEFDQADYQQTIKRSIFNLPFLLRLNSKRLGNFAMHTSFGGGISIDITGQNGVMPVIFTKKTPFFISVGAGMDVFLEFFKMGFELRWDIGVGNQLLKNENGFEPLDKLRANGLRLIISFEG